MKNLLRVLKIGKEWHWCFYIATITVLLNSGINLFTPALIKNMVAVLENGEAVDMKAIIYIACMLFVCYIFRALFQFINGYFAHKGSWNLTSKMRCMVYDHIQSLSMSYFSDKQTGQLMSRVINDTGTFEQMIAHVIPDLVSNFIIFFAVTAILFTMNPTLAALTCIPIPFIAIFTPLLRRMTKYFKEGHIKIGELNAILQDNFSGIREIQIFNKQKHESKEVEKKSGAHIDILLKALFRMALIRPTIELMTSLGTVIVVGCGGYMASLNLIKVSEIIGFLLYLGLFYQPVGTFSRILEDLQNSIAGADRVFEVLDTEPEIVDRPSAINPGVLTGRLEFKDVCFSYIDGQTVLENIDFSVNKGEMIALVGATGVGKTTIAALISRFYEPTSGKVLMDDIDISEMTLKGLRNNLSVVLQDVFLFNGTVEENIAYGTESASLPDIMKAAKYACVHDFIMSLPEQYDTQIGERGVKLSGGQKQRISIARSILRDSPVLILDEATSAVDTETEREIQRAIDKIAGTRTMIVIAHRLSTVKKADKIIVLENGKISEMGKHDELIKQGGVYTKLCNLQLINK